MAALLAQTCSPDSSNSPDCNSMNLWNTCGAVEKDTNRAYRDTKDELIARVKTVFARLMRDIVKADFCMPRS